jgi:hypothetical protein
MAVLEEVFGGRLITRGFWPPITSYLNSYTYYLYGTPAGVYVNIPNSLQKVKDNITQENANIPKKKKLRRWFRNIIRICEACAEARGRHFETLL